MILNTAKKKFKVRPAGPESWSWHCSELGPRAQTDILGGMPKNEVFRGGFWLVSDDTKMTAAWEPMLTTKRIAGNDQKHLFAPAQPPGTGD